jgi:hypothetical protein
MSGPLFLLGQAAMTSGVTAAIEASGDDPLAFSLNTFLSTHAI